MSTKTYYLVVSRHRDPRIYKRWYYPEEGERYYRLQVEIPDAPPLDVPAEITVSAPEAEERRQRRWWSEDHLVRLDPSGGHGRS